MLTQFQEQRLAFYRQQYAESGDLGYLQAIQELEALAAKPAEPKGVDAFLKEPTK